MSVSYTHLDVYKRQVITLCDIEGLSYDYIAEVLGIPSGTVKSRINRARSALKKKMCIRDSSRCC